LVKRTERVFSTSDISGDEGGVAVRQIVHETQKAAVMIAAAGSSLGKTTHLLVRALGLDWAWALADGLGLRLA